MVYRHPKGRTYVFQALRADGVYEQLGTGSRDRAVAKDVAHMWGRLARKRAWDLLEPVLQAKGRSRRKVLLALYDLWEREAGNLEGIRQRRQDRDVGPLVAEWATWYGQEVARDTADHALAHVRWLLPEGETRLVSQVTIDWLTQRLTAYAGKRNTRRKVHSSWSGLFGYLTRVHRLWPANPMDRVPRPAEEGSPIRFYELEDVERIVAWQPTPERKAMIALLYGTGCEVSVALRLTRRDFDPTLREVRTRGTKTSTRDRISRVADWAWSRVWEYVAGFLPDARPWRAWTRFQVSSWHRAAVGYDEETKAGLNFPADRRYPLHCARDHWAVRYLRSGGNIQVVAAQLGHRDSNLTLRKYGRFQPQPVDRERLEEQARAYDERRKSERK